MNKATYELTKQQNLGARMAKALESHLRSKGKFLSEDTRVVPNRAARRRMGRNWQRIEGAA